MVSLYDVSLPFVLSHYDCELKIKKKTHQGFTKFLFHLINSVSEKLKYFFVKLKRINNKNYMSLTLKSNKMVNLVKIYCVYILAVMASLSPLLFIFLTK